jgi:hypothetical protein
MAFIMFAGLASAVVGADCPPKQPCIMSGGGPNTSVNTYEPIEKTGPDWNSSLKLEGMNPASNITERVVNETFSNSNSSYSVNFDGVMKVNSGCYIPAYNVTGSEDSYTVDIYAEKKTNQSCTQVITQIDYSFELESEEPFKAQINQGNISETFEHSEYETDPQEQENSEEKSGGLLSGLFNWLSGLF